MDAAGNLVIGCRLGTAVKPPYADFWTAQGEWTVERTDPFVPPGPKRTGLRDRFERLDVIDSAGNVAAMMHAATLTLADGEELFWIYPGQFDTACALGGDLWVARANWPRRRGFRAEVSGTMLAREDRGLLIGIAAMLTQTSLRKRRLSSFGDFGGV